MLTPEEVRHVAMLARLGLTDQEVEKMRHQLSTVLEHIAMLQKLDTSAIEPTAQVLGHINVMRPDEPRPSWPPQEVLINAPAAEDGFFRVPAVLEEFRSGEDEAGEEING
jgi:aspartyl-tRNA(Asn)/glutamyl-tRNA(Gln) amidotransferase subunit C